MITHQRTLSFDTRGRELIPVTGAVSEEVSTSGIATGLCNVFIHHTSASLILCENADPDVCRDLEAFMARLVPDGDALFRHTVEGPDDMPAHVRTVLTQSHVVLPITAGRCGLGTWQGVFLWEHRYKPQHRRITVTAQGSPES